MGTLIRIFLAIFVALWASFAHAQSVRSDGATLIVAEVPVLRFRSAGSASSPTARAEALVANLLTANDAALIDWKKISGSYVIRADERPVITVTSEDAAMEGSTVPGLAAAWAKRLKAAFGLPALQLSTQTLSLPVGMKKAVKVTGMRAWMAEVSSDRASVALVQRTPEGMEVNAVGPGRATIVVAAGGATAVLVVDAVAYAAQLPQTLTATVLGNPATSSTIQGAVESAVKNQFAAQPNATWTTQIPELSTLGFGESKTLQIPISVTAPSSLPRRGNVSVLVRNLPLKLGADDELWYCNAPESVKFPQPLFSAFLGRNTGARLLYHHVNESSQPMIIRVQVVNDRDEPAQLAIMPGDSAPDRNPVLAGIDAAEQYIRQWIWGSAEVVTVPPRSTIPISVRRVAPGETVSGLCSLRLLSGPDNLLVRTDALPPFSASPVWQAAMNSRTPWRETGPVPVNDYDLARYEVSPHVYPDPYKHEPEYTYRVGERHAFIRIGEKAISRQDNAGLLDGNFGVFYDLRAKLENPTAAPAWVDLNFIPSAGYSGALFVLNGALIRSPLLPPQSSWRVTRVKLEPGQTRTLQFTTMPLSGSSYPITLQIGATGPLTAAGTR